MFGFKNKAKERETRPAAEEQPGAQQAAITVLDIDAPVIRIIEEWLAQSHAYLAEIQTGRPFAGTPAEKVSAAKEFVHKTRVGMAALRVWDATIYYHAWSKNQAGT